MLDELQAGIEGIERAVATAVSLTIYRGGRGGDRSGLDLHQGRGHDEKIARIVDIDVVEFLEKDQELLGNRGDGDIENIHLCPADEVQQQIQRTVKCVKRDLIVFLQVHGDSCKITRARVHHSRFLKSFTTEDTELHGEGNKWVKKKKLTRSESGSTIHSSPCPSVSSVVNLPSRWMADS